MSHPIEDDFADFFAESAKAADASLTADIQAQIEASAPRTKRDAAPAKVSHAQALQLIADRGCAIGGAGCRHLGWLHPGNWCSPCIAASALESPSLPESASEWPNTPEEMAALAARLKYTDEQVELPRSNPHDHNNGTACKEDPR